MPDPNHIVCGDEKALPSRDHRAFHARREHQATEASYIYLRASLSRRGVLECAVSDLAPSRDCDRAFGADHDFPVGREDG